MDVGVHGVGEPLALRNVFGNENEPFALGHVFGRNAFQARIRRVFGQKRLVGRIVEPIDETAAALNHTLVDEFPIRLFGIDHAEVEQEFMPETRIYEVTRGVFGTADVQIHGAPVVHGFARNQRLVVVRIHITQEIGAGTGESGHRIGLQRITVFIDPILGAGQRRFAGFGRQVTIDFGQRERQFRIFQRIRHAVLVIDGEGFAPIALPAENGVAQAVERLGRADPAFFDFPHHDGDGFLDAQAVEEIGMDQYAVFGLVGLLADVAALYHGRDRQIEALGKAVVARVVRRHGHDGARAVTGQYVIRNPDGNRRPRKRMNRVGSREYAADAVDIGLAFAFGSVLDFVQIGLYGRFLRRACQRGDPFVFGTEHHEADAKERVGPRREDVELVRTVLERERERRAVALADPVALHLFERVAPLQIRQAVEQPVGIGGDAQLPLLHQFAFNRVPAALGKAVHDLVVGEHRAQLRTPIDHRVGKIGQPVGHERPLPLLFVVGSPVGRAENGLRAAGRDVLCLGVALFFKHVHQSADRLRLFQILVVPRFEQPDKDPLCPFIISGVARTDFAVPVERETDTAQLLFIAGDVLFGRDGRVLAGLNRVLFGRQTVGVEPHGVQDVEAVEPFVTRVDVARDVAQRMADMQARARRVGEHVQYIVFGLGRRLFGLEGLVFVPIRLPTLFDVSEIVIPCHSKACI